MDLQLNSRKLSLHIRRLALTSRPNKAPPIVDEKISAGADIPYSRFG